MFRAIVTQTVRWSEQSLFAPYRVTGEPHLEWRMGTFLKVFGGISFLVVAVVIGVVFLSPAASRYMPSDTVLEANQIARNPYKFKGMSGIMAPGEMHFSHMAGDQIAVYDMNFIYNDDQLAVVVDNNDPPKTNDLWWRVYVEGADDFTNGLGASVQVAEVHFEGYTDPPPQPALELPPVQPQSVTSPQPTYLSSPIQPDPQPETAVAPIVRQTEPATSFMQLPPTVVQTNSSTSTIVLKSSALNSEVYGPYLDTVVRAIDEKWGGDDLRRSFMGKTVQLIFDINRDGKPSNIRIVAPSGSPPLDLGAVYVLQQKVGSFAPLPAGDQITVEYTFNSH